jgi:hypothetical protein
MYSILQELKTSSEVEVMTAFDFERDLENENFFV